MDLEIIQSRILEAIPDADICIEDVRGDGAHYTAKITAAAFTGKPRVEQHRMVYAAIKEILGDEMHTLTIQTLIPAG